MSEPESLGPVLIRTAFSRQVQWDVLRGILLRPCPGGKRPDVTVIDDPVWEDATHFEIRALAWAHSMVVVADERALDAAGLRPMILRPRKERVHALPLWRLAAGGQTVVPSQGRVRGRSRLWVPTAGHLAGDAGVA